MLPREDPLRRCLKVAEWPAADQHAWAAMLKPGHIIDDDRGAFAHLSPTSVHMRRRSYGRWIGFLGASGRLDVDLPPAMRIIPATVADYLEALARDGVATYTVRGRIRDLHAVAQAFAPTTDWAWLRHLADRLSARAVPARPKQPRMRRPAEILDWALREMDAIEAMPPTLKRAIHYRDALMVALLVTCPSLRRSNLAAIRIGHHLLPVAEGYDLAFAAHERKARRPDRGPVAPTLSTRLERYLADYRPLLLDGRETDRLWVSHRRNLVMSDMAVYHRITLTTRRAFGVAINPHLFRDIAATGIAIDSPAAVGTAAPVLDHASAHTTERYYLQAHAIEASRRVGKTIADLRRQFAGQQPRRARRRPTPNGNVAE